MTRGIFSARINRILREGKTALQGNAKTGATVDFTTSCPYRDMGRPCLYCYVESKRHALRYAQRV